jgi:hypothetical protein
VPPASQLDRIEMQLAELVRKTEALREQMAAMEQALARVLQR